MTTEQFTELRDILSEIRQTLGAIHAFQLDTKREMQEAQATEAEALAQRIRTLCAKHGLTVFESERGN